MTKIFQILFNRKTLLVLFALAALAWLFGLFNRYIEPDEYVLAEYSFWFLHEGIVRLKTIPEILSWDERVYAHHRFFTWYGAFIQHFFGWSITALKVSILPLFGLFFFWLHKYFKLEGLNNNYFLIAAFLVFTSPIILLKSFSFRPDVILMMEGMAVFYFLKKYREDKQWISVIIAGAFAGLAFLTHLNGVAFCIAGFFFLLIRKEFKAIPFFVLAGALVGGLYFIELLPKGEFENYIYELTHWPTINHGENYAGGGFWAIVQGRVAKLLSEHQRFFWGDEVIAFSAIFFLCLLLKFKYLKENYADVLLFFFLLVLALNIFGSHVAERYLLFYYGPMSIICAISIVSLVKECKAWKLTLLTIALFLQLLFAAMQVSEIYARSYDTVETHKTLLSKINNKDRPKILGPYELVFNEFPNYDLYTYKTYEYLEEDLPKKMTSRELLDKAFDLGMEYVIINNRLALDKDSWFYNWKVETEIYKKVYRDDRFMILKRKANIN